MAEKEGSGTRSLGRRTSSSHHSIHSSLYSHPSPPEPAGIPMTSTFPAAHHVITGEGGRCASERHHGQKAWRLGRIRWAAAGGLAHAALTVPADEDVVGGGERKLARLAARQRGQRPLDLLVVVDPLCRRRAAGALSLVSRVAPSRLACAVRTLGVKPAESRAHQGGQENAGERCDPSAMHTACGGEGTLWIPCR